MTLASFKLIVACGVLLAGAASSRSQPLAIRTLAGSLVAGDADGFGSNAKFSLPTGMATDGTGNVFVTDTQNATIRKIAPDGFVSTLAGRAGYFGSADGAGTNAQFYGLQGIASDSQGNLYVTDTANATLRKITPAGGVTTLAGDVGNFNSFDGVGADAQFYQPEGVTVDAAGNICVADAWNHTIRKITPAGVVSTLAGLAGNPGSRDGPNSAARFNRPSSLAADSATNLFVTDSLNHTIRRISPAGLVTIIAGLAGVWGSADGTNTSARFFQPQGIVALGTNTLFVADSGNNVIRRLTAEGTNWIVSTVAGLPGGAGSANGTGSFARFDFPAGLAADGADHLHIADAGNHLVRTTRVVPPTLQTVSTHPQLVLSWPTSAEDFVLESSPGVGGSVWTTITNGIVNLGDNFGLTNSADNPAAFYRLHKP